MKGATRLSIQSNFPSRWLLILAMGVLILQTFLGTEVRAAIDVLANSMTRNEWVSSLGNEFFVHRAFSWLVLLVNGGLLWQMQKTNALKTLSRAMFLLILCSLATGIGMAYLNVPPYLQPVHLVLATIVIGLQLIMFFRIGKQTAR
ncbi:MAG: COX15/CtaA family protein [Cyclobacteriaceae bacterium]